MVVYFTGFRASCLPRNDKSHRILSPHKLDLHALCSGEGEEGIASSTSSSTDQGYQKIHDCALAWASILVVNGQGAAYLSNKSDTGWRLLETEAKVESLTVKWTDFWLLLTNGKLHSLKDTLHESHVHQTYEVKSKGDNSKCVSLNHLEAGEQFLLACSEGGECGEVDLSCDENQTHVTWSPLSLPAPVTQVSCGKEHAILLTDTGQVYTHGLGSRGQLGHSSTENCTTPTLVEQLDGLRMTNIAAGGWHTLAVSEFGDLYVWGWNESGQLGLPSKTLREKLGRPTEKSPDQEPVVVVSEPCVVDFTEDVTFVDISAGSRHSAIVADTGSLLTTGWNDYGQLGLGDVVSRDCFTTVTSLRERHLVVDRVKCGYWGTVIWTSEEANLRDENS